MEDERTVYPILTCKRCGATWRQRKKEPPKKCPKCQNPNWNRELETTLDVLRPAPQPLTLLANPLARIKAQSIGEMRAMNVHVMDCALWLTEGLEQTLKWVHQIQRYTARSLALFEKIYAAGQPTLFTSPEAQALTMKSDIAQLEEMLKHPEAPFPEEPAAEKPSPAAAAIAKRVHKRGRKAKPKK